MADNMEPVNEFHGKGTKAMVTSENLVKNSVLTLIARGAMIFASTVCLPIAGYLLLRIVTAADKINDKVSEQGVQLQLLQQSVKFGFDGAASDRAILRQQLNDHEGRIRTIESEVGRAPRQ